ncbi:MAG: hypothetical protein WCK90_00465 [archaeon]
MDRLFVALNVVPFEDFREGNKTYELRAKRRGYTRDYVYSGRKVELRKGYNGKSLWGKIGHVETGDLQRILRKIGYKKIIPRARSLKEALGNINELLGSQREYIAFEVLR